MVYICFSSAVPLMMFVFYFISLQPHESVVFVAGYIFKETSILTEDGVAD